MFNNDNERFLEDPKRHSDEDCQAHTEERRLCEWCNHMFPVSHLLTINDLSFCLGCCAEAQGYQDKLTREEYNLILMEHEL